MADDALRARLRERLTEWLTDDALRRAVEVSDVVTRYEPDDYVRAHQVVQVNNLEAMRDVLLDHLMPALAEEREALAARLAEAERNRERTAEFAAELIGEACGRHLAALRGMTFEQFKAAVPTDCAWCANERLQEAEAKLAACERQLDEWKNALDEFHVVNWIGTIDGMTPREAVGRLLEGALDVERDTLRREKAQAEARVRELTARMGEALRLISPDYDGDKIAGYLRALELLALDPESGEALKADAPPDAPTDEPAPCPQCGVEMGHGRGLGKCSACLMLEAAAPEPSQEPGR